MKENMIPHYSGRLVELANGFIARELSNAGIEGIVPSHGDLLCALFREDGLAVSEIARRMNRTKSTVSVLTDKLEKYGFVERRPCPGDKRAIGVWLTQKALDLKPLFARISDGLAQKVVSSLSEEEALVLNSLLKRVVQNWPQ